MRASRGASCPAFHVNKCTPSRLRPEGCSPLARPAPPGCSVAGTPPASDWNLAFGPVSALLCGAVGAQGSPQSGGRGVSLLLDQTPQGPWCPLLSPQALRLRGEHHNSSVPCLPGSVRSGHNRQPPPPPQSGWPGQGGTPWRRFGRLAALNSVVLTVLGRGVRGQLEVPGRGSLGDVGGFSFPGSWGLLRTVPGGPSARWVSPKAYEDLGWVPLGPLREHQGPPPSLWGDPQGHPTVLLRCDPQSPSWGLRGGPASPGPPLFTCKTLLWGRGALWREGSGPCPQALRTGRPGHIEWSCKGPENRVSRGCF